MSATNDTEGFEYRGKQILYIDEKGKDIGFHRWRLDLYYAHHLAETYFLPDELSYEVFLAKYKPRCFETYDEFRRRRNENI